MAGLESAAPIGGRGCQEESEYRLPCCVSAGSSVTPKAELVKVNPGPREFLFVTTARFEMVKGFGLVFFFLKTGGIGITIKKNVLPGPSVLKTKPEWLKSEPRGGRPCAEWGRLVTWFVQWWRNTEELVLVRWFSLACCLPVPGRCQCAYLH